MKACTKCLYSKELTEFYNSKHRSDGKQSWCKDCTKTGATVAQQKDPEARREYLANWRLKNAERFKESKKEWAKNNVAKIEAAKVARLQRDPDYYKRYTRTYYKEHTGYMRKRSQEYRGLTKQATPSWADLEAINEMYKECSEISKQTGISHHVDHIIPLRGKLVCGLHVEANLRIIPAEENRKKSAKLIEELI